MIPCFSPRLQTVALEVAALEYNQYSNVALSVEKCHCPPNYVGLSCEECADGYYRLSTGPFGGWCVQCQCNGHATSCDKATGVCHVSILIFTKLAVMFLLFSLVRTLISHCLLEL